VNVAPFVYSDERDSLIYHTHRTGMRRYETMITHFDIYNMCPSGIRTGMTCHTSVCIHFCMHRGQITSILCSCNIGVRRRLCDYLLARTESLCLLFNGLNQIQLVRLGKILEEKGVPRSSIPSCATVTRIA